MDIGVVNEFILFALFVASLLIYTAICPPLKKVDKK